MSKETRKRTAGYKMADALIEWAHMMYNYRTAEGVIRAVIERLSQRVKEYTDV